MGLILEQLLKRENSSIPPIINTTLVSDERNRGCQDVRYRFESPMQ